MVLSVPSPWTLPSFPREKGRPRQEGGVLAGKTVFGPHTTLNPAAAEVMPADMNGGLPSEREMDGCSHLGQRQ